MPSDSPIQVLGRHEGGINDLAVLGNEAFLTAGVDGTVRRWNLASQSSAPFIRFDEVERYAGEPAVQMFALALDQADGRLACALKHGVVEIRDLKSGSLIRSLENPQIASRHPYDFCRLSFNPADPTQLAGTNRNYVNIWDIETGQIVWRDAQYRAANTVAFLRGGSRLLVQEWDPWFHLYEWPGGNRIRWQYELVESSYNFLTLRAAPGKSPFDFVLSALDAGGGHIVAMNIDRDEALWEAHAPDRQHDVDVSDGGKIVVAGGDEGILRVFDDSGDELLAIDVDDHPTVAEEAASAGDLDSSGLILTTNDLEDDAYPPTAIHRLRLLPDGKSAVVGLAGGLLLHINIA